MEPANRTLACRGKWTTVALLAATVLSGRHSSAQLTMELTRVATGLASPLYATHAPGDSQRLYVVEKTGAIRILGSLTDVRVEDAASVLGDRRSASLTAGCLDLLLAIPSSRPFLA